MAGFTKLFSSITDSTVWSYDAETCKVWITMLAMADKDGYIAASIPGLAKRAGLSIEAVEKALSTFSSPDPYSRTKDHEGRRIEEVDGGWILLNYIKYRNHIDEERTRELTAARNRRYRERQKQRETQRDARDAGKMKNDGIAEAEAEADTKTGISKTPHNPPFELPAEVDARAWENYDAYRRSPERPARERKAWTAHAQKLAAKKLSQHSMLDQREMVEAAIIGGWQGLHPPRDRKAQGNGRNGRRYDGSDARPGESWEQYEARKDAEAAREQKYADGGLQW